MRTRVEELALTHTLAVGMENLRIGEHTHTDSDWQLLSVHWVSVVIEKKIKQSKLDR